MHLDDDHIYIAIGSNLPQPMGSPLANGLQAIELVGDRDTKVIACSAWYETVAEPDPTNPLFVNAVIQVTTQLTAFDLLQKLLAIEQKLGRVRENKNAPRSVDLDLLTYGQQVIKTDFLELPHPRIPERIFVLKPWNDLRSFWRHPVSGLTISEMLQAIAGHHQPIKKIYSSIGFNR